MLIIFILWIFLTLIILLLSGRIIIIYLAKRSSLKVKKEFPFLSLLFFIIGLTWSYISLMKLGFLK